MYQLAHTGVYQRARRASPHTTTASYLTNQKVDNVRSYTGRCPTYFPTELTLILAKLDKN